MSGVATAIAGSAIIGGVIQGGAARDAANTQAGAARDASALSDAQFQQQRADQEPWRAAGAKALTGLQDTKFQDTFKMSDYQQDPGFQFRMDEGNKAINAAASSRGMANSGATMKALTRYGQDYGSSEYSKAYDRFNNDRTTQFNRLSSLAGVGQTANAQLASSGNQMAANVGSNIIGAGNAAAAGQVGQANAIGSALNGGANAFVSYQMMNRPSNKMSNLALSQWGE